MWFSLCSHKGTPAGQQIPEIKKDVRAEIAELWWSSYFVHAQHERPVLRITRYQPRSCSMCLQKRGGVGQRAWFFFTRVTCFLQNDSAMGFLPYPLTTHISLDFPLGICYYSAQLVLPLWFLLYSSKTHRNQNCDKKRCWLSAIPNCYRWIWIWLKAKRKPYCITIWYQ